MIASGSRPTYLFSGNGAPMVRLKGVLLVLLALTLTTPCQAYNEFQKVFLSTYAGRENPEFRKVARKAKCYLCHQGKEDRKNCNRYGEALKPLLGEEDKKNKEKIAEMLAKVAEELIDKNDKAAGTFGELIAAGELPGGTLEECKIEPEKPEESEIEEAKKEE